MQNTKMPVIFLGHGSPMNAIENNEFSDGWKNLAKTLPAPRAILCISAHWETEGVFVTASENPETIYDFYGFPEKLFAAKYDAPGNPALAKRICDIVTIAPVHLDKTRGLDHGVWSVLLPMYPEANIPVVQLSLDRTKKPDFHYNLAKQLAPLREEGVLIIASGDIVHNLRMFNFHAQEPYDWSLRFNEKIKELIITGKHDEIINYKSLGQDAALAIPTDEHYLPLLYAIALQNSEEKISFINDKVMTSISMTSVVIGK